MRWGEGMFRNLRCLYKIWTGEVVGKNAASCFCCLLYKKERKKRKWKSWNIADREVHFVVWSRRTWRQAQNSRHWRFRPGLSPDFHPDFGRRCSQDYVWLLVESSNFAHNDRAGDSKCRWICLVLLPHNHFGILGSRMDTQHPYGNTGLAKICWRLENSSGMENYLAL